MTLNCLSISFNGRSTTKLTGYKKLQGGGVGQWHNVVDSNVHTVDLLP